MTASRRALRQPTSALCDELAELVGEVTDSRTGQPLVARVLRTRAPEESGSALPPADLIVCWRDDVGDRCGGAPPSGSGGTAPFSQRWTYHGRVLSAGGRRFHPGVRIGVGQTPDLTATLLARMGCGRNRPMSAGVPSPTPLTLSAC